MQVVIKLVLLLVFSGVLATVLSCYRHDHVGTVVRGILRRTILFAGAVLAFSVFAGLVSGTILHPGV